MAARSLLGALLAIGAMACSGPGIPSNIYCFVDGGGLAVCGVDGITYQNDSYAVCSGVAVAYEGVCADGSTGDAGADGNATMPDSAMEAGPVATEAASGAP